MRRALTLLSALLLVSCSYTPVKVEVRKGPQVPVYYAPVKGERLKEGRGLFIRSRCGAFFRSVGDGRVIYVGKDVENFGWVLLIEHTDGFVSVYGKVKRPWVRTGERVKARQVLGKVGRTRRGCGLYFELRNRRGDPIRPVLR
jgi:murein DD-endopeptidase MepM/ murein hydrolase activator NlpD